MREITIAFDIDGTILNNQGIPPDSPHHLRPRVGVNLEVIILIQILSKKMKNTKVIVWSGGGKEYAERILREYGLEKYVHAVYDKADYPGEEVDIAFDDIQSFDMAKNNIIVRMK